MRYFVLSVFILASLIPVVADAAGFGKSIMYGRIQGGFSNADGDLSVFEDDGITQTINNLEAEIKESFVAGFGIGAEISDNIRLEAEYRHSSSSDGDMDSFFANAYLNMFQISKIFSPYVMGGIGYGYLDTDGAADGSTTYQLGLGIDVPINPNLILDLGYRYQDLSNLKDSGTIGSISFTDRVDFDVHNFLAGLKFTF